MTIATQVIAWCLVIVWVQPNFAQLTRLPLTTVHYHHSNGSHAPTAEFLSVVSVYHMKHVRV